MLDSARDFSEKGNALKTARGAVQERKPSKVSRLDSVVKDYWAWFLVAFFIIANLTGIDPIPLENKSAKLIEGGVLVAVLVVALVIEMVRHRRVRETAERQAAEIQARR